MKSTCANWSKNVLHSAIFTSRCKWKPARKFSKGIWRKISFWAFKITVWTLFSELFSKPFLQQTIFRSQGRQVGKLCRALVVVEFVLFLVGAGIYSRFTTNSGTAEPAQIPRDFDGLRDSKWALNRITRLNWLRFFIFFCSFWHIQQSLRVRRDLKENKWPDAVESGKLHVLKAQYAGLMWSY